MSGALPIDFTLKTDQLIRLTLKQACTVAKKLADGEMKVSYAQVFGKHRPWVEIKAGYEGGVFTLAFGLNEQRDQVTNLWVVLSPSGKIYSIDHEQEGDSGKIIHAAHILTKEQFGAIDKFIPQSTEERRIVVTQYWKIEQELLAGGRSGCGAMMDKGRAGPKGLSFPSELGSYRPEFSSEKEAEAVAQKLREYLSDQSHKSSVNKKKEIKKK